MGNPSSSQEPSEKTDTIESFRKRLESLHLFHDEESIKGLEALIGQIEPLIAGRRLEKIIHVLSILADLEDMSDAYMIERLMKTFEDGMAGAWSLGNAARQSSAKVSKMKDPPTLFGLFGVLQDPDVRRGLLFLFLVAGALGRQMSYDGVDLREETVY
jgi:uncharacterized protein YjgD (DUF1641 family)